jgi:uncharacterized protein YhbP (UPF0306 family)
MAVERSKRPMASARMARAARSLLDASTLCAIASVGSKGSAYVNTAYFAVSPGFELVWLSDPQARHSRNIRANHSVAVAVYDSRQSWGTPDRGIQLFGAARELEGDEVDNAQTLYARRFSPYRPDELGAYRFYGFRPRRLKLFDERELGSGRFVTARVMGDGSLRWERTEIYRSAA